MDLSLLKYDANPDAVINPFRDEGYHLPTRMAFTILHDDEINAFAAAHNGKQLAVFETVSANFPVYAVTIAGERIGLCRCPLGAPAATQLLEFLIAYGARQIIAVGSCGVLDDQPENKMLVVRSALRDEGTSFHYLPAADIIRLDAKFAARIQAGLATQHIASEPVNTWTTDAFFRETRAQVQDRLQRGFTVVEMECAALAACAEFRGVQFGQILFTGDSLADVDNHNPRDFGTASHNIALEMTTTCLATL